MKFSQANQICAYPIQEMQQNMETIQIILLEVKTMTEQSIMGFHQKPDSQSGKAYNQHNLGAETRNHDMMSHTVAGAP